MRSILVVLIVFGLGIHAQAVTITSTAAGGNWSAGGSWVGGVPPAAGEDAFIVSTATMNLTTSPTVTNLRNEGILNFGTNGQTLTVTGNLTFAGTGSTTGNNATRGINVTGNFISEALGVGIVTGINLTVTGTTDLTGKITFNNATGTKTLLGPLTIQDGGALEFTAAATVILTSGITMNGTSSLGGASTATGVFVGVSDFTVNAGANATVGRLTLAIVGVAQFNGLTTFNNANGSKSFVGGGQINNGGAIEFSAGATISFTNALTMNGTSSLGGASTATGTITNSSTLTISAGAAATIGRGNLSVTSTTQVDGTLTLSNATGTKTLSGDVTVASTGSILFSAAATVGIGANLTTNPGAILGNTGTTGTINVGSNFNVLTGGSTFVNGLNLNAAGNISVPGTAVLDLTTGTSALSLGGNWNISSAAANPFVEGTSAVTFTGTAGTQTISTTEVGGEHFYDFGVNNTSATIPGVTTSVTLNVAHNVTFTAGTLDLTGKDLLVTGSATTSTDTYTAGTIYTSIAGSVFTVTDATVNKTVNFNGTTFGDAINGIPTTVTTANSFFNGSVFYGNAAFTKTGVVNNDCNGGNIFYGPVSFTTLAGADRWRMGNVNPDIFYNATFTHNGNNNFIVARSSLNNEFFGTTTMSSSTAGGFYVGRNNGGANGSAIFHGPVVVSITLTGSVFFAESNVTRQNDATFENTIQINSTASSTGNVTFGSVGFGSTTLTPTGQFVAGSVLGACTVSLIRLTQNGAALTQTITLGGTSIINCGGTDFAIFNAPVAFTAPQVQLRLSTFNGTTNTFTQTGAVGNANVGGNTFVAGSSSTFTNQGAGFWRLGNTAAEDYNGDVNFIQSGAGVLAPSYTNNSTYAGNISTVGSSTAITFGSNSGRVTIDGASAKSLNADVARPPVITQLTMNGTGALTLNIPTTITTDINFTTGVIFSTTTNLLVLNAGTTVSGTPSNTSHVDGPLRKVGNTAFSFPVGNTNIYRPISISAPSNIAFHFTAQYFKAAQALAGPSPTFARVSSCEYWQLNQTNGASSVTVTLSWNSPDCPNLYITDPSFLNVGRFNGTNWVSEGNGGTTGNATTGTIVSAAAVSTFGTFTLASLSGVNPLPIQLVSLKAVAITEGVQVQWLTATEVNNDYFTVQRSLDGLEFESLAQVKGHGTSAQSHTYTYLDKLPAGDRIYYRLKQTDFDGKATFSQIVSVNFSAEEKLVLYPNPARDFLHTNRTESAIIYDMLFQPVLRTSDASHIDLSTLAPGNYMIRTETGQLLRFIKVN